VSTSAAGAARRLLSVLDEARRRVATYPFDDEERQRWQYTPGPRGGLAVADMPPDAERAALELLRTGLSDGGYRAARAVMALETVLRGLERDVGRSGWERRDPEHYWFAIFGDPGAQPWGWRVGGHHVCVHVTVVGDHVRCLPLFLGANPATAPDGSRILGAEEDLGHALVHSLDAAQRAAAVLSGTAPDDILTANAARAEIAAVPRGIGYPDLSHAQRRTLTRLVACYAGRPAAPLDVDVTRAAFAWLGSTEPGEPHYYAVRADPVLIELDNTQNGANHVHTVVRDVERDWGEDLLADHYARSHR
jgi:hypothetical protein